MPSRKLTEEEIRELAHRLREINKQSADIHQHIEFIRDNAGLPPFRSRIATAAELLTLIRASETEFVLFAQHHVPIYLGQCLIDEFAAHWSVEDNPSMAMFGQPYVDGFGNIDYENVYLSQLTLENEDGVRRFEYLRATCRRAFDLRANFTATFAHLAGSSILRSDLEQKCVSLKVLPKNREAGPVWRQRVTKYAQLLNIHIKRG